MNQKHLAKGLMKHTHTSSLYYEDVLLLADKKLRRNSISNLILI